MVKSIPERFATAVVPNMAVPKSAKVMVLVVVDKEKSMSIVVHPEGQALDMVLDVKSILASAKVTVEELSEQKPLKSESTANVSAAA